ncbi:nitroreductase family protein [Citricoccus sp. NPDC055426]|uniref:nitroreductase family protein n=1 Tax=Citricoccus sp. NPDC055426 TaxID=3155536 RepID=UPI00343E1F88
MLEALLDARHNANNFAINESSYLGSVEPSTNETQLTKDYHRVEKGLALRNTKRPFGSVVRSRLVYGLENSSGEHDFQRYAQDALIALDEWNNHGIKSDIVAPRVAYPLSQEAAGAAKDLLQSRRSVRDFDSREVEEGTLLEAFTLAANAPSVCNRQPWKAHFTTDRSVVTDVLRLQNGNAGFRSEVPALVVVSVDSRLFSGAMERNQQWIDGGIFAMSLVTALESTGLSSCMLNCSMRRGEMEAVSRRLSFEASEQVVVMIAVGYAADGLRVARSERRLPPAIGRRISSSVSHMQ